jgi:hypothetical protein
MKYVVIAFMSMMVGYILYPIVNPPREAASMEMLLKKLFEDEARRYAEAETVEKRLKAADALYEKMMLIFLSQLSIKGPEIKPIQIITPKAPTPIVYIQSSVPTANIKSDKKMTLPERIMNNMLSGKDIPLFSTYITLDKSDARIKKLTGLSLGKLKLIEAARTGTEETIKLKVGDKTELNAEDNYDNVSINYSTDTILAFKGVPGDENLLLMILPEYFVFFDLRSFPQLVGKIYRGPLMYGSFTMKKAD